MVDHQMNPPHDVKSMIEDINNGVNDEIAELNPWETEFIENISKLVERGDTLTEPQDIKLEQIWRKVRD